MRLVRIKWTAKPRTIKYQIQYREVGSPNWSDIQDVLTNYVDVLLEVGKSYQFRVRSVCPDQTTDWSYLGVNVYSNDGACQTPTGVTVEQLTGTYDFRITWDNAANASSWNFRYRKQGDLTWITSVQLTPEITLSNLVIGAIYEYQVQTICTGGTVSDWGNIGTFMVRSATATQDCPVTYEEDWSGTINGRKDSGNTVKLNGGLNFTGSEFPEADSYTDAGSVGECCAPLTDIVLPVDNAQFKGEVTITAAGQIVVYVELYKGSPAISYTFSNLFYQGYEATCPPPVPPPPSVVGTMTFTLPPGNTQNGHMTMNISFSGPTQNGITFKWGYCVVNNAIPGFNYCYGFPGASHDNGNTQYTQAIIGTGASSYLQESTRETPGAGFGYITKVYIYQLSGITPENLQLAAGQNYQLIFL